VLMAPTPSTMIPIRMIKSYGMIVSHCYGRQQPALERIITSRAEPMSVMAITF
jgi:hypothetical protein